MHGAFQVVGNVFCRLAQLAHDLVNLARCSGFVESQLKSGVDELFVGHISEEIRASNRRCQPFIWPNRIAVAVNPGVVHRRAQKVVERRHTLAVLVHQERDVLQVRVRVPHHRVEDDPADLQLLSNREKTLLIDALKENYGLPELLAQLGLARSSYFYHRARAAIGDKYVKVRQSITEIFESNHRCYPQEAENILMEHPLVQDVAVIGVPNSDFGEEVKAVVELKDPLNASSETAELLISHCRERLSHIKCPRTVDFASELPRTDTGKLLKRVIRDQ